MLVLFSVSGMLMAAPTVKFFGYQWLRYTWYQEGAEQDSVSDKNGFNIPRTYIRTSVKDDDVGYDARLTLDINNVAGAQTGADWSIWVKYGYVDLYKLIPIPEMTLRVGLQNMYFGTVDPWGYPIATSAAFGDRHKIAPASAEQGVALVGLIPGGWGEYQLALYNGAGYKKLEDNTEKMGVASLLVVPFPSISVRGSYLRTNTNAFGQPAKEYSASAVVLNFNSGPISSFVEYNVRTMAKDASAVKSGVTEGISSFLGVEIIEGLSVNLRYDMLNPDTMAARDEKNYYMGSIGYKFDKNLDIQIAYELEQYKFPSGNPNENKNTLLVQTKYAW